MFNFKTLNTSSGSEFHTAFPGSSGFKENPIIVSVRISSLISNRKMSTPQRSAIEHKIKSMQSASIAKSSISATCELEEEKSLLKKLRGLSHVHRSYPDLNNGNKCRDECQHLSIRTCFCGLRYSCTLVRASQQHRKIRVLLIFAAAEFDPAAHRFHTLHSQKDRRLNQKNAVHLLQNSLQQW